MFIFGLAIGLVLGNLIPIGHWLWWVGVAGVVMEIVFHTLKWIVFRK